MKNAPPCGHAGRGIAYNLTRPPARPKSLRTARVPRQHRSRTPARGGHRASTDGSRLVGPASRQRHRSALRSMVVPERRSAWTLVWCEHDPREATAKAVANARPNEPGRVLLVLDDDQLG